MRRLVERSGAARLAQHIAPFGIQARWPQHAEHHLPAPHARHRWRDRVVPRPPVRAPFCKGEGKSKAGEERGDAEAPSGVTTTPPNPRVPDALEAGDGRAAFLLDALVATRTLTTTGIAERVAPNVLSLTHWDHLLDGELYASSTRLGWRTLLKRTFDVDLRVCVRCGGRLTVRAVVSAPAAIARMLAALRRPRAPPAAA